jgi:hypothetical protein
VVFRARAIAAGPAVARTDEGAWVAFHHDLREDRPEQDVSKWIALRFVRNDGAVLEPSAPMSGRDRDAGGVEQSFEFPALHVGRNGAVTLVGRGSHNFWRQDLDAEGFGPRVALSDGEWGSRGRRATVCPTPDGGLLVARREKVGIVVDRLDASDCRAPEMVPATVDRARPASVRPPTRPDPARRRALRTFFGDIQQHSAHSDGIGAAEEAYLRARDRYGDDFVALTDHEAFLGKRTGPGEWEFLKRVADRHDDPGRFTTLIAYEWTGRIHPGPGHKCVYFPTSDAPLISRDDVPEGKDLVRRVHALGGFASPHHVGWTGCDEPGHDDAGQPVWEICSCHGCYEHADHPLGQRGALRDQMVDEMLRKGHRFGFTASSDSHGLLWHHGESRKRDPYRTGLTAVQAENLDRASIFEAIQARRCYATSGAKILLDFEVDGAPMGSVRELATPGLARGEAIGTDRLAALELVGPEGVLARVSADDYEARIEAVVKTPFVYLRVVQSDGEMAWSSPVFWPH